MSDGSRYQTGDIIPISWKFTDGAGDGIINASGALAIRRTNDDKYFNGSVMVAGKQVLDMIELSEGDDPGWWDFDFDTTGNTLPESSGLNKFIIEFIDLTGNAINFPAADDYVVGGYIDNLDTSIASGNQNIIDQLTVISGFTDTLEVGQSTIISDIASMSGVLVTEIDVNETKIDAIQIDIDLIKDNNIGDFDGTTDSLRAFRNENIAEHNATQSQVSSIQNNTRANITVMDEYLRSDTENEIYRIHFVFRNTNGGLEDPDSNQVDVSVEDGAGVPNSGVLTGSPEGRMIRDDVGQYRIDYTVASGEILEQKVFRFTYFEASSGLLDIRTARIVNEMNDLEDKVDIIDSVVDLIKVKTDNLPSDPASETNVDVNETKLDIVISNQTAISGLVDEIEGFVDTLEAGHLTIINDIAAISGSIPSEVWNQFTSTHNASGSFGALLNELFVNQSLIADVQQIQVGDTAVPLNLLVTQGGNGVPGETVTVKIAKPGTSPAQFLDFADDTFKTTGWATLNQALSEVDPSGAPGLYEFIWDSSAAVLTSIRLNAIFADAGPTVIGSSVDQLDFVDNRLSESGIADAVWEELDINHTNTGTMGKLLNDVPDNVWNNPTRTLTSVSGLEINIDASGVVEIASGVWDFATREITSLDNVFTSLGSGVWSFNDRTLSDFEGFNIPEVASGVWNFATRTLTSVSGLEINIDDAGVTEIASGVWSFNDRSLTNDISSTEAIADAVWEELTNLHNASGTFGALLNELFVTQSLVGAALQFEVGDIAVPLTLLITQGGSGVIGETVTVNIFKPGTSPAQFLDFTDDTFKTTGWTTKEQPLSAVDPSGAPGLYEFVWNSSVAITNTQKVHAIYSSLGPTVIGTSIDQISFVNSIITSSGVAFDVWHFDPSGIAGGRTLTNFEGLEVDQIASGVWNFSDRQLTTTFGTGDGSVVVNHNFGGTDNLRVIDDLTASPVDNVIITAYLKSDFDIGNTTTPFVKGQTFTNVTGKWSFPLNLDPGTYTLNFAKQGIAESKTVNITVT